MSKERKYTQCQLVRDLDDGQASDTAWIPSSFAVVGKKLRIKDQEGWWVKSVGSTRSAKDFEREHGADGTAYQVAV